LAECISSIKAGNTISVPNFDFITQKRSGFTTHKIDADEIIIFEGIQAVYPEITSLFKTKFIGVFINVNEDICINNIHFTKNEIRLIRRIVRDEKFRGATPEFTFYLWESVRENEEKSIFPNKDICEIQIDSFMCYELFLMKSYLIKALDNFDENSKYYANAKALLDKIINLDDISYDYIPKGSLYTEFLGKK
jgi:uridine kinase